MSDVLDWAIVGGGIHGVHVAVRLLNAGVEAECLRIIDPGAELLSTWKRCASNTGMRYLRSPAVHHLDVEPFSLLRYGGSRGIKRAFTPPYSRPSLALFTDHCEEVTARYELAALHVQDTVSRIDVTDDGVVLHRGEGEPLAAQQVLLAMGNVTGPRWPEWAASLRDEGADIRHVFESGFVLDPKAYPARVAVIGGGISAAQVALRLVAEGRDVHLVSRHAVRQQQFDADPGWVGPKNMREFLATADLEARRKMIANARHSGSMPRDVHRLLKRGLDQGVVQWHLGKVTGAMGDDGVVLRGGKDEISVDAVVLATGFASGRPRSPLLDRLVEAHALPCSPCGFPIVDEHLRWHPRIFVTGPLAELEIGPASRNIAGARRAAERIVTFVGRVDG